MSNLLLTSYIANLNTISGKHRDIIVDMTNRGFPCILSNDINPEREYPYCSQQAAALVMTNRIETLRDSRLGFFFLFMNESERNEIAAFELGMAVQSKAKIVLIGNKIRGSIFCSSQKGDRILRYYNYEDFTQDRFEE